MTLNEKIGFQLRFERMRKKLTIDQMAQLLHVAKNTVSYLELGKKNITVEDLKKYCEILDCNYVSILERADSMED